MAGLRDEIIESQKVRSELLKWKLIIVSALGGVGLGFTEKGGVRGAYLVLLLLPLVCFYVDLLCRHISLRILVIGHFLRLGFDETEAAYEHFVAKATSGRSNVFALEEWALEGSTMALSVLVVIAGFLMRDVEELALQVISLGPLSVRTYELVPWLFAISGAAGILLTWLARRRYHRRILALNVISTKPDLAEELMSKVKRVETQAPCAREPRHMDAAIVGAGLIAFSLAFLARRRNANGASKCR